MSHDSMSLSCGGGDDSGDIATLNDDEGDRVELEEPVRAEAAPST